MVIGHHLIWTAYGWWLPNDPRGSSSHELRVEPIAELAELHQGRKSVQPLPAELRRFYEQAREVLRHPLLSFTDDDIRLIGEAFAETIRANVYTCYECAIMPEHVHMLVRRHRDKAEVMIQRFQADSRQALIRAGRRSVTHPVWGGPGWKVFQNTREDMERTAAYVGDNPEKAGRPRQHWAFVTRYDGWVPGFRGG